jgi:hypothetical protein
MNKGSGSALLIPVTAFNRDVSLPFVIPRVCDFLALERRGFSPAVKSNRKAVLAAEAPLFPGAPEPLHEPSS